MNDECFDILYQLADTVIEIREISSEEIYKNKIYQSSSKEVENFFNKLEIKYESLETDQEKEELMNIAINFLIASIKKMVVICECPDENIEILANHITDQLMKATRKEYEKSKC